MLTDEMRGWLDEYDGSLRDAVDQFGREFALPPEEAYRLLVEHFWHRPKVTPSGWKARVYNFFK